MPFPTPATSAVLPLHCTAAQYAHFHSYRPDATLTTATRRRHLATASARQYCWYRKGNTCRSADNDMRALHSSPRLPVLALCRRVTGAAADALSRLASIGGVALALHLRSTSTLPHPSRRPITIYLLVFQHC
ncbi:hypothetical protein Q7P36_002420 [Cladosporium allicinum]